MGGCATCWDGTAGPDCGPDDEVEGGMYEFIDGEWVMTGMAPADGERGPGGPGRGGNDGEDSDSATTESTAASGGSANILKFFATVLVALIALL